MSENDAFSDEPPNGHSGNQGAWGGHPSEPPTIWDVVVGIAILAVVIFLVRGCITWFQQGL